MTTTGEKNRYFPFKLTEECAARMAAGEMTALASFVEENRSFLTRWARKILRNYTNVIPAGQYEEADCINQMFVDFSFYDYSNGEMLIRSIFRSYIGIAYGGFKRTVYGKSDYRTQSLDAPMSVSGRSGDKSDGDELGSILPSRDPIPSEVLERKEHVQEIAPYIFHEVGRIFGHDQRRKFQDEATIGEMLAAQKGEEAPYDAFRDVIEEVFFGLTFEEVRRYAYKNAA